MSLNDRAPRISVELTEEQMLKLQRYIPWGLKTKLFRAIIDDLIELLESHQIDVITGILNRQIKAYHHMASIERKDDATS